MSLRKVLLRSASRKGFTLVELMVSMGVMAIILGITMSGGPQSINRLSIADNTYQAELLLREAQLQGSSISSLGNVFGGAGLYFSRATPTRTVKFRDRSVASTDPSRAISVGDGLYSVTPIDEKDSLLITTNGNVVGKLCVATSSPSVFYCNVTANTEIPTITSLTVSFSRPKQTAHIYINDSAAVDYAAACIQFDAYRSPEKGYVKSLYVYKSGMITKKTTVCK